MKNRLCCNFVSNVFIAFLIGLSFEKGSCTDVVIQFPNDVAPEDDASYRLDYSPPEGVPAPNTTILAKDMGNEIQFSQVLPGTKYEFTLYYSNSSLTDWAVYTASITTVPDPPSNLNISVINGTCVIISFDAPKKGEWSSFNVKLISILEKRPVQNINVTNLDDILLSDLTPGGTYQVQISTFFDDKESVSQAIQNFTTRPSTPVKFLVWFRNETTLKFLWQPPPIPSIYSHYKVMIVPKDTPENVLIVEKGDPPGPANAVFKDLVPGRPYNLSVQTLSENVPSLPISAQYRTTPLPPSHLKVLPASVTTNSFTITWDPPEEFTEYEKYQISINLDQPPVMKNVTEPRTVTYSEHLQPGKTYKVSGMTVSGKVSSAPSIVYITLKPLPVKNLKALLNATTGLVFIHWKPDNSSTQDSYEISYTEVYNGSVLNGDTNVLLSTKTEYLLDTLLPGRNYSISVKAVSKNAKSSPIVTFQVTKPSAPVIEELKPTEYGLNISWKSDVNSRQEMYEIFHHRNDTKSDPVVNITEGTHLLIENLYPGAGYNIRIFAVSHGLKSEPHDYFQAVYPKPPTKLLKSSVTSNSVILSWEKPKESLFSGFSVRFRTEDNPLWNKHSKIVQTTGVEIKDLEPGQRYFIEVNSVSFEVESAKPPSITHTVYPSPVTNIAHLVDSKNITFEFPRPPGRIEYYVINWIALETNVSEQKSKSVSANGEKGHPMKILIDDLTPGVKYQFDIHTVSFELHSNPTLITARTMPLILTKLSVEINQKKTDVMTISYTPTPWERSRFHKYRFNISDSNQSLEKAANDTEHKVTFSGLVPGKLYNITVWTVAGNVLSQPLQQQERLFPDPVRNLRATHITDTTISLAWDPPMGQFSSYEIQYLQADNKLIKSLINEPQFLVRKLRPYRNYTFTVGVRSGNEDPYVRNSELVPATFCTQEGLPEVVKSFQTVEVHPREITFSWFLPESDWNGVLKSFRISYQQEDSGDVFTQDFSHNESRGTIKGLEPGKLYLFNIQAQTKIGFGPGVFWKEEMPILAPPKPNSQVVPTEVFRTSSTIQIRFRKNYFSEENGPIIKYTVIVAEDENKNASGLELPSWFDVQAYSVWPPYQVREPYYPFENSNIAEYTIGEDDCTQSVKGYCNGPLKEGTVYRVKIRAFTTASKFIDTYYSFPIKTDTNKLPVILGSIFGAILVIVLIILLVILRKMKIEMYCTKKEPKKIPKKKTSECMSLADCILETSKPIKVGKFAAYYEIMSADSCFKFSEEFEQFKTVGKEQPCTVADFTCNRPKNRFTNILPYDHSRFKLQPIDDYEGSDYINANYIPGYHSPREFIATQGPLPSTKDDFWRMCWESNSRAIVMLTKCFEKGREKCDHYWPEDTNPVYYGDICVTILNETYLPNWTITELVMQRGEVQKRLKHFHFTIWPDFGVPNPPTILVRFVRMFRERVGSESRPIVVHCSAGVGRSGTFIAIDRILQSLENKADVVDVFNVVYQMRKERVLMVQTEQQYICIHQCILAVLNGTENQLLPAQLQENQDYEDEQENLPSIIYRK